MTAPNHAPPPAAAQAAPETGLVRATADCPSRKVRWVFAVLAGTPQEAVLAEIAERVAGTPAAEVLQQPDFALHYPDGPWVGLPTTDPIGSHPAAPPADARPPAPRETGLPRHPAEPTGDRAALLDLDGLLTTWRSRYGLTSSEYYAFLAQALARAGAQVLTFERQLAQAQRAAAAAAKGAIPRA